MNFDPFGLACSCKFNSETSKKDGYKETWYGQERTLQESYQCEDTEVPNSKQDVLANHTEWYLHDKDGDDGREGNPLGTTYSKTARYNSYSNTYTYDQTGYESFDPKTKTSSELSDWAKNCGC